MNNITYWDFFVAHCDTRVCGMCYLCSCQVCVMGELMPGLVAVHLMSHGLLRGWTLSVSFYHLKHTQRHTKQFNIQRDRHLSS